MNDANARTEQSQFPSDSEAPLAPTGHWDSDEEEVFVPPIEDYTDRMLGEFRLLRLIGRGGMAEVYLADQTSLSRKVAIKILRPEYKANSVFVKRFEREARAAASLSHPNIVQVYVVGEADGLHFIAQEYVKGWNLREYIRRKGPPDTPLALHFMKQVVMALDKAGRAGIVHRDIKPENLLINSKGVLKVTDFGLAQLMQSDVNKSSVELTQVGTTMGTPLYMSPEQVHGHKLDQRSDLYSLGVTCFHMLAGEPPFRGETAMSVAVQHLNDKPPRLQDRRPDLPPALCQVVHRLMAKKPDQRYADASAVLKNIKQIQTALKEDLDPASLNLSGAEWDVEELVPQKLTWMEWISRWSLTQKIAIYSAGCLAIAGISAGVGWLVRPIDPLSQPASTQPKIPIKNTAAEQYNMALQSFADDEEAWKAVIENFSAPADTTYVYQAQEQLGALYLRTLKLEQAEKVFHAMSQFPGEGSAAEYRTKALAGRAVVAYLQKNLSRADALLEELDAQKPIEIQSPLQSYVEEIKRRIAASHEEEEL